MHILGCDAVCCCGFVTDVSKGLAASCFRLVSYCNTTRCQNPEDLDLKFTSVVVVVVVMVVMMCGKYLWPI
jgi:hypothetical protein